MNDQADLLAELRKIADGAIVWDRAELGAHDPGFADRNFAAAALVRALTHGPRPIATGRLDQDRWPQLLTYIRLPDAAGQRLRREPRWIFARFHLIGPKALAEAKPVHTPGSGSDGMTV